MRTFNIIAIVLLFFAVSLPAMATQPRKYTDDEKEFFKAIYDNCKKSVDAQLSEKDFQKTLCFAHLKGTEEGAKALSFFYMWIFMGTEKTCKDLHTSLEAFTSGVCFPKDLTPYQFAKDYTAYVDELNKSRPVEFYGSPADLYYNIYACDRKPDTKQSDAK